MGAFSRLDVPVVFGALRDRWFAVAKPAGVAVAASPPLASVEATLRPFCEGSELGFPIRLERDVQGLQIVTTDDAILRCFHELVRRRLVRSTFRVLADVSGAVAGGGAAAPLRLPGGGLAAHGSFPQAGAAAEEEGPSSGGGVSAASSGARGPAGRRVRSLPPGLQLLRAQGFPGYAEQLRTGETAVAPAATFFELISGPIPCLAQPGLLTASYLVRPASGTQHMLRGQFAAAGCPVMFDALHHPAYRERAVDREDGTLALFMPQAPLAMQLCTLEFPDPFRPDRDLRIHLPRPPADWEAVHPSDAGARSAGLEAGATEEDERASRFFG